MPAAQPHLADSTRRSRTLDVAAVLLFALVVGALSWRLYEHRPTETVSLQRWALASYRDVIYFPLVALGDGINPYDSVRDGDPARYMERYPVADHLPLYSPFTLLLFSPLAILPVEASTIAFAALNGALFVVLSYSTIRIIGHRATVASVFALSALLLASQPGRGAFNAGQISAPLALAILGALQWGDRRRWRSAALVALSTMKPTFGGPFGLLLAARGDWRSAFAGLAVGGVIGGAGMLAIFAHTGELSIHAVTQVVSGNHGHLSHDPEAVPNTNKARTDLAAVYEYLTKQPVPRWASVAIAAAILTITIVTLWRSRHARDANPAASPASALIVVAIFIGIFHNVYDLPLLIVPLAACVTGASGSWNAIAPVRRLLIAAMLLIPFVNVLWTQGFRLLLERAGIPWGENAGVFLDGAYRLSCAANGLALLAAWGMLIVCVARRSTAGASSHTWEGEAPAEPNLPSERLNGKSYKRLGGCPPVEAPARASALSEEPQAVVSQ